MIYFGNKDSHILHDVENLTKSTRENGIPQISIACKFIIVLMLSIMVYCHWYEPYAVDNIHVKFTAPIAVLAYSVFSLKLLEAFPKQAQFVPLSMICICTLVLVESQIQRNPNNYVFHEACFCLLGLNEYFSTIIGTRRQYKMLTGCLMWSYYLIRLYLHYGYYSTDLVGAIMTNFFFHYQSTKVLEDFHSQLIHLYDQKEKLINESLHRVLELVPSGIFIHDTLEGRVSYANSQIYAIASRKSDNDPKEDFIEQQLQVLLHKSKYEIQLHDLEEESKINEKNEISTQISSADHTTKQEMTLYDILNGKDGNQRNLEDSIFKIKNTKKYFQIRSQLINKGSQTIVIMNDISRIKALESTSKKVRAMFFSSVTHELRTPLNAIIPMSQRLEKYINDQKGKLYLRTIINSSLHLQNVIEDALDVSRIENNKFQINQEFFDIRESIQDIVQIMQFQVLSKKLQLNIEFGSGVPSQIFSDQKRFKQVLFNLIGNSIKFTFEGAIKILVKFQNGFLITDVEDTGIGIKDDELQKLFSFFGKVQQETKINQGGMGFGLTISKMLIQQMKGQIKVISEFSKGTKITFSIKIDDYKFLTFDKDDPLSNIIEELKSEDSYDQTTNIEEELLISSEDENSDEIHESVDRKITRYYSF